MLRQADLWVSFLFWFKFDSPATHKEKCGPAIVCKHGAEQTNSGVWEEIE